MLAFCGYLLRRTATEAEIRQDLEKFVACHLGAWVDQYLNLQQLEAHFIYPVWVAGLVEEGLNQLRADLGIAVQ